MSPDTLRETFKYVRDTSDVVTRSATNMLLYVPKPNCEMFKRSLSYLGPMYWNSLPEELRCSCDINQFKCKLKHYILGLPVP